MIAIRLLFILVVAGIYGANGQAITLWIGGIINGSPGTTTTTLPNPGVYVYTLGQTATTGICQAGSIETFPLPFGSSENLVNPIPAILNIGTQPTLFVCDYAQGSNVFVCMKLAPSTTTAFAQGTFGYVKNGANIVFANANSRHINQQGIVVNNLLYIMDSNTVANQVETFDGTRFTILANQPPKPVGDWSCLATLDGATGFFVFGGSNLTRSLMFYAVAGAGTWTNFGDNVLPFNVSSYVYCTAISATQIIVAQSYQTDNNITVSAAIFTMDTTKGITATSFVTGLPSNGPVPNLYGAPIITIGKATTTGDNVFAFGGGYNTYTNNVYQLVPPVAPSTTYTWKINGQQPFTLSRGAAITASIGTAASSVFPTGTVGTCAGP